MTWLGLLCREVAFPAFIAGWQWGQGFAEGEKRAPASTHGPRDSLALKPGYHET